MAAGLVLLVLGAYGRVSGHLPDDNPYRNPIRPPVDVPPPWRPATRAEVAADIALAAAYRELAAGTASAATRRDLRELDPCADTRTAGDGGWTSTESRDCRDS